MHNLKLDPHIVPMVIVVVARLKPDSVTISKLAKLRRKSIDIIHSLKRKMEQQLAVPE
jgi:hypothetical protein